MASIRPKILAVVDAEPRTCREIAERFYGREVSSKENDLVWSHLRGLRTLRVCKIKGADGRGRYFLPPAELLALPPWLSEEGWSEYEKRVLVVLGAKPRTMREIADQALCPGIVRHGRDGVWNVLNSLAVRGKVVKTEGKPSRYALK